MIIFLLYITLGLILNFNGPLAIYLKKEDKYALKQNENKNWFYRYLLIIVVRLLMTIIYPLFFFNVYILNNKPIEPISFLDKFDRSVVIRFREIGKYNNIAPTEKSSDKMIIEIYTLICTSFRKASLVRKEHIPANSLNVIALKFMKLYEDLGEEFMNEHLEYELNNYKIQGLRPEYKYDISLF
ncbi:hypothetical protein SAMN05444395_11144 [Flavobacterium fryxellicola]|uniref:Uncharacterized protein n=1 Tax=Flavobacterium fryxellicola TaxID=249352 RepID=A0A167ZL44_9FLAO|nr:hypothetical protein [Flavobacterium fryxellicola]OAB30565.1 hypothetical protein FBFR_01845 [Flavobacterium fryxellicola]SHN77041.1 hypothetical protein SAMN05444395_11144 [Flavobacterium fryxellicola]